jgi:hypothetical protein
MNLSRTSLTAILLTVVASAVITLTGFGSDSASDSTAAADSLATKVNAASVAVSGLTSTAVADRVDAEALDLSFTKTIAPDALNANSLILGTNSESSQFPMTQVTNPVISNCDSTKVCTLNATLVNSDVDTTSVDFSTKVILVSGVYYFYGDQFPTPSP